MTAHAGDDTADTLFTEGVLAEPGPSSTAAVMPPRVCWLLTNRMNLNGILSSRIIGPEDSFVKYYQDLLELTPGWVPLLNTTPGDSLVQYVGEQTRTGPALLELPRRHDTSRHPTVDSVDLSGPIPFSQVTAIHLPDEKSLREHAARHYANTHPHEHLLRVTPDLFTGDGPAPDTLQSATTAISPVETFDWRALDRLRGAISAAVLGVDSERTLHTAAACIPGGPADGWIDLALLRGQSRNSELQARSILFRAAYEQLAATDTTQAWDPANVLRQVRTRCSETDLPRAVAQSIERNLETIRAVITNEREFTPFRAASRGLTSAKALLLVLLRQEITELLRWPVDETGADDETRQTAIILAGALRGLSRQEISNRNVHLDDLTATWGCSLAGHKDIAPTGVRIAHTDTHLELHIHDDVVALARSILANPAAFFDSLASAERQRLAPSLAQAIGAPETRRTFVTAASASITPRPEGGLLLELPGDAEIEFRYDDTALAERLSAATDEQKSAAVEILQSAQDHADGLPAVITRASGGRGDT